MIEKVVEQWHAHLRGEHEGGLDALLDDDVVFYSPIVFSPQVGKEVTKLYLNAAANTLGGEAGSVQDAARERTAKKAPGGAKRGFHYTKQILSGNQAMLEFETTADGKYVNGVDIITCNAEGRITEFKVMIRPLQAIQLVHAQMARMLEKMKG